MKKILLSFGFIAMTSGLAFAQSHDGHNHAAPAVSANTHAAVEKETPSSSLTVDNMVFNEEVHDFGDVPEGPAAEVEFKFKNTGKEPILIQAVRPSCGCTTPTWSKDPVLPGQTGVIKASYGTEGRPNGFTKSITVTSNAGTKVLTIKGNVEAAPKSSVPANSSMIKG